MVLSSLSLLLLAGRHAAADKRPNILFMLADGELWQAASNVVEGPLI
jgi:hypothetical protein